MRECKAPPDPIGGDTAEPAFLNLPPAANYRVKSLGHLRFASAPSDTHWHVVEPGSLTLPLERLQTLPGSSKPRSTEVLSSSANTPRGAAIKIEIAVLTASKE